MYENDLERNVSGFNAHKNQMMFLVICHILCFSSQAFVRYRKKNKNKKVKSLN